MSLSDNIQQELLNFLQSDQRIVMEAYEEVRE